MAMRIYSLAKDLGLDNKELVEIVKKAGISGKGSALASLEDEEGDKVKQYMADGDKPSGSEPPLEMTRPEASDRGSIKVVTSRSQPSPLSRPTEKKEDTGDEPSEPEEAPVETTSPEAPASMAAWIST